MSEDKKLNMPQSLLLLLLIIGSVAVCIRLKTGGPMIGLFMSWIIIYLFCKVLRINYEHVVNGAYDAIRVVVPTLCLLMAIGVMIGTWLQSGTIATIIVGGLKLINPNLAAAADLNFLCRVKPGNRNFLRFRGQCWRGHDGHRQCHGHSSGHGSRSCHLRCHVWRQIKPAFRHHQPGSSGCWL